MDEPINSEFIRQCLDANELGDAMMYIAMNRGKRLYNQASTEWMRWAGHHWEIDQCSADAMAAVEEVVTQYLNEARALVDPIANEDDAEKKKNLKKRQGTIYSRVDRLRSVRGSNNCLTFTTRCTDRIVTVTESFDLDPWKLPMINGVVDLKTGELSPGNPNDMLLKACPHEWAGIETPCPLWESAIHDIMSNNDEMVDFLQRLFGYAITGLTTEHIMPVFFGKGRNGKSMLVETIRYVMGSMAAPIRSEMLLDQSFSKSSAGPTPDIMSLKGLRVAFASETDEGRRLSTAQVKSLTGGDTMVGRNPHDRYETRFNPSHTLFLLTNNKPQVPADDFAIWKRLILIPFAVSFVVEPYYDDERKIDKFLGDKLKDEAPGILAWLVRGCLAWQERGLDVPTLVRESTGKYRRGEDTLMDFLDECCVVGREYKVRASEIYDVFLPWFQRNISKKGLSQKKFGNLMLKKFTSEKHGVYYYYGVGLADPSDPLFD